MKKASSKKSYRELKEDPYIKAPALAWLLDRKLLYISVATAFALVVSGFLYQGLKSYEEAVAPPEDVSPYLQINPSRSIGVNWGTELLKNSHGVEGWEVKDSVQPNHGFLQDATGGTAGEVPVTLLATQVASSGPVRSFVQVYGAGQARRQYDFYVEKLAARGPVDSAQVTESGIMGAKFELGFILAAGDSIVGAQTSDNALRDRLFAEHSSEVESTLLASKCASVAAVDEAKRSIYFDPNGFEGLLESKRIEPQVNASYLPTLQGIGAKEISNPYAVAPEAPLPAVLPTLPAEVAKPTIQPGPATIADFSSTASYRVQDPIGPGCGWSWSAQNPLEYDDADLEAAKSSTVAKVQNEVNDKTQGYVDSKIGWARVVALTAPALDSWNRYTESVNSVHAKWDKLVADREALRPAWDQYLVAHESWATFDARKAASDKAYNEELKQCLADRKTHDEWEKEWGADALKKKQDEWRDRKQKESEDKPRPTVAPSPAPSATASPTADPDPMPTAPAEPKNCEIDPVKPEILSQQKPAKPAPPALAEDVTIPNSWPKPQG